MKSTERVAAFLVTVAMACSVLQAQQTAPGASTMVPRLVNFSGSVANTNQKPISRIAAITFSIYKDQYEGSPLWMETQNVQLDVKGNYTVQLGVATSEGLPLDLFTSGEARWLGVRVNGGEERPRILLLSVPYALKAADAQTLGGLPASAFALAGSSASGNQASESTASTNANSSPNVGGSGTQNYLPLWTDSNGDLGNSILYQTGSGSSAKIGINETKPLFTLDVNGQELVRGLFEMATTNYANKSKGFNSNPINLESSAFNSGTQKYTLNHFQWQAEPTGNNTSTPGATLNLLYGTDPNQPAETGLSLNSQGVFTFASGQTFPGTGTITAITAGTDLTGGGTSGKVTLNLDTTKVPQLSAANTFTQTQTVNAGDSGIAALQAIGNNEGVEGDSPTSGVVGVHTGTGTGWGVFGSSPSAFGYGVEGKNTGGGIGIYGVTVGAATPAIEGSNSNTANGGGYGVEGVTQTGYGIYGLAVQNGTGVYGVSEGNGEYGVYGISKGTGGVGVYGQGSAGVYAVATSGPAVYAFGGYASGSGGSFYGGGSSSDEYGGDGIYAQDGCGTTYCGYAGYFDGSVFVYGNLGKLGGSFQIDHPLDPANKYLYHSFVESPDMMNIYNGNASLDQRGEAVVVLPDWFQALNRDFRYQLTAMGAPGPNLYIAEEISGNHFKIAGGKPGGKVSWQVTGVRHDVWADAHRIPVEEEKPARERGFYLTPELYGAPKEKQVQWARHPKLMQELEKERQKHAGNSEVSQSVAP